MPIQVVYSAPGGQSLELRTDEGATTIALVSETGVRAASPPLSDDQMRHIAQFFLSAYWDRTKKIVWPVNPVIASHYERDPRAAEDALVEGLRASPAEENKARAEVVASDFARRRRERGAPSEVQPPPHEDDGPMLAPEEILATPEPEPPAPPRRERCRPL